MFLASADENFHGHEHLEFKYQSNQLLRRLMALELGSLQEAGHELQDGFCIRELFNLGQRLMASIEAPVMSYTNYIAGKKDHIIIHCRFITYNFNEP